MQKISSERIADKKSTDLATLDSALFESSPDCVKLLNADGRILAMNENGQCIMQIDDFSRVVNMPLTSLWPEESHPIIQLSLDAACTGKTAHFAAFCPTAKGTAKWWDVTVTPIPAANGRIEQLLAVSRDVTAEYLAKEELQASQARFSLLLESSGEGIYGMGPDKRCTFMNRTGATMLGYAPDELIGRQLHHMIHHHRDDGSGYPEEECRLAKAVSESKVVRIEDEIFWRKDGTPIAVSYSVAPIVNDGIHDGAVITFADITQRRQTEKSLHESEERLRLATDAAKLGIWVWDVSANQVTFESDRLYDIFGMPERERTSNVARLINEIIHPDDIEHYKKALALTAESGARLHYEGRFYRLPNHELRWFELTGLPYRSAGGKVLSVIGTAADTTDRKRVELALYDSRERLEKIISQAAAGVVQADTDGRITLANQKYCDMLGFSEAELLGTSIFDITAPESISQTLDLVGRLTAGSTVFTLDKQYRRKDGSFLWATCSVNALRSQDGQYQGLVAIVVDITQRKHAEQALWDQTEKLRLATEAAQLGLFDHDIAAAKINWNSKAREQFGVAPEVEITREVLYQQIHPDDRDRIRNTINRLWTEPGDGRYRAEYRVLTAEGTQRWIAASGQVFYDPPDRPVRLVGTTMDVSERKENDRKLQEASQHDSLTGLPNRALLYEYCSHILAMSARYGDAGALLFIDLDRFKPINDMYGHDVGDKVLQQVARRLQECIRKEDIVSRLGGDEFIVVLPRITARKDACVVAEQMLKAIGQPIHINALQVHVSPSIGISLFPDHASDLELLIRCADTAMYAAKRDGRNDFRVYSTGLSEHASGLLRLEILLKHALETNRLALYYQPILDVQSRQLIGAEALIRIPAEDGTLLGPTDFIQVAETAGLMNRMGEWVVNEACRQHRAWRDMGLPPITIAVNVSPTQFRQTNFVSILEKALNAFDIDPGCLQLEVTESTVMHDLPETIGTLNQLKAMGVKTALDDFGTGYSSLSHLSNLPLDKLKIDQSFVMKMTSSQSSRSITEAIIGLGQTLNLKVVGEGVESEECMELLREYGCNQAQGFLFSEPLPPHGFVSWYQRNSAH